MLNHLDQYNTKSNFNAKEILSFIHENLLSKCCLENIKAENEIFLESPASMECGRLLRFNDLNLSLDLSRIDERQ